MLLLHHFAARLPQHWQSELRRARFARQIKKNSFVTDEPEYEILPELIGPGDWVIDIGANVGHYTKRFSELVGANGRVIAFEPIPTTFSLLAANAQFFAHRNVTLVNAAVSNELDVVGMSIPEYSSGMTNYYQAHISAGTDRALSVFTLPLDLLVAGQRVALVKIDAEGHEAFVLAGMQELMQAYHPVLIVENPSEETCANLVSLGYDSEVLSNSPNTLFKRKP